jgi:exopolyphosphatase/guanosine-5'-triphosphate,3'-diphosphate pyrophosphatase
MLHDIGMFLSFSNHHAHTYYIIGNAELLGFYAREIAVMAATAFYHSKKYPKKKHPEFSGLDPDSQELVKVLSMLLSIAESLDRTHHQLVHRTYFSRHGHRLVLNVEAQEGHEIEIWALENHQKYFKRTFGEHFEVETTQVNEQGTLSLDAG